VTEPSVQTAILAGGLATRMRPHTETVPKSLLTVAGKPFLDHQLAWLASCGVDEVVLCIAHLGEQIRRFAGDGDRWGLKIAYCDEGGDLRGTAGALKLAQERGLLREWFAVLYGDSYLPLDVAAVARDFLARRALALMTVYRNDDRHDRSNAVVAAGTVVRYEKGVRDPIAAGMHHIDYGLQILDRDAALGALAPGARADLADLLGVMAAGGQLAAYEVSERFYEIGSPAGLAELDALLRSREVTLR
jgi:NDP-sugar pyrophosphorylase family protein